MRHHEVDQYAKDSTLYGFDPRIKIMSTVVLIVVIAFLHEIAPLIVSLIFILSLMLFSGVPARHLSRSYVVALPFIVFASIAIVYSSGLEPGILVFLRISDSVLALLLLITTTPFFDVLKALRWFRVPSVLASLLLFTYRFIFVFIDELERMGRARRARGFSGGRHIFHREALRTIAYTAGMVFVRAHRRADAIYNALRSRGYNGEVRTLSVHKAGARDAVLASSFFLISALSIIIQLEVVTWSI